MCRRQKPFDFTILLSKYAIIRTDSDCILFGNDIQSIYLCNSEPEMEHVRDFFECGGLPNRYPEFGHRPHYQTVIF